MKAIDAIDSLDVSKVQKPMNLLKAVKTLNIGIGTAVEFLNSKGFEIEAKPSSVLSIEMVETLFKEFKGEKDYKKQIERLNKIAYFTFK